MLFEVRLVIIQAWFRGEAGNYPDLVQGSSLELDSYNQVSGSLSDFLLTPVSPTASQGSPSFCIGSLEEDSPFPSFAQVNPLLVKQPKGIYHELYFLKTPLLEKGKLTG